MSLEDALRLVAARGRLMGELEEGDRSTAARLLQSIGYLCSENVGSWLP